MLKSDRLVCDSHATYSKVLETFKPTENFKMAAIFQDGRQTW